MTDHLGNVVVLFEDKNGDGKISVEEETGGVDNANNEVLQRNFYYSFGMKMQGPWEEAQLNPEQNYLYNGKEDNPELGLNWLSFGFREYDPAIARFPSVDPIADNFAHVSGFNYAENDPVGHIDLWGLQSFKDLNGHLDYANQRVIEKHGVEKAKELTQYFNIAFFKAGATVGAAIGLTIIAVEAAPAAYTWMMLNPEAASLATTFVWGLGTDADVPGGGDDLGRGARFLFRGTTAGYKGNKVLQKIGVTPTSTDPLVATLFGIESKKHGKGVLHITSDSDLSGVTFEVGNVLSQLEKEVVVNVTPETFEKLTSITLDISQARKILKDMGFSIPQSIRDKEHLQVLLKETPRLTNDQVNTFINKAQKLNE